MRYIVVFIISIFLLSCTSKKNRNFKELTTSNNPIKILVKKNDKSLILDEQNLKFELTRLDSNHIVGEVSKLLFIDDNIFILDKKTNSLFCFNQNGKTRWVYNKTGRGYGDHGKLTDFSIRSNVIYLFDLYAKCLKLDFNGKLITQKRINFKRNNLLPTLFFVNSKNDIVIYNSDMGEGNRAFPFKIVTIDSSLLKIKSVYLKKTNAIGELNWENSPFPLQVFNNNKGFYYSEALNDTIYSYRDNEVFERKYVIDFGENKVPKSYLNKKNHTLDEFWNSRYGGIISDIFDNDSLLIFRTFIAGQNYFHFFNKSDQKVENFNMVTLKSGIFTFPVNFIGGKGSKFYFTLEPYAILAAYKWYKENKYKSLTNSDYLVLIKNKAPLFYKLIDGINLNSNSVLLSVEIPQNKIFKKND